MKGSIQIGRLFGIRVLLHWSFFLIIPLVIYVKRSQLDNPVLILEYLLFVLLIFCCVVMHEYGHALTARRYGIRTHQIILLPIGGIAQLEHMPERPQQELWVAIAGPLVNVALAFLGLIALFIIYPLEDIISYKALVDNYLGQFIITNIFLVIFNLLPAFPMDGGRILRALLTFKLGYRKATLYAARLGQIIAIGFVIFGFLKMPLMILTGAFVFLGAEAESRMVMGKGKKRKARVSEGMISEFTIMYPEMTLKEAVQEMRATTEKDFLVIRYDYPIGILTLNELVKALSDHGNEHTVQEIMKKYFPELSPGQNVEEALEIMRISDLNLLPVIEYGKLVGVATRDSLREAQSGKED